jgi:Bifunctional DNA primase/polymerase, N-terminal
MIAGSNRGNGESQEPERDASTSSTTSSEAVQLDLFERQTGEGGRTQEPLTSTTSPAMTESPSIFADWAGVYRQRGYWPRPITPGTKACHVREWQKPDSDLPDATLASRLTSHADFGIGLLMGSPFPDGTTLGALDIDLDEYVRIGQALLRDPPCGRIGKKGAVLFVRVRGRLSNHEFKVRGDDGTYGKVAECLFTKRLCVIPPTIHPDTRQAYHWIGKPLHEVDFGELAIVEMSDD